MSNGSVTDETILAGFASLHQAMAEGFDRLDRKIDAVDSKVDGLRAEMPRGCWRRFPSGGQTLGTALVAIVFGIFGTALAGAASREVVAHAAPAVLWLACGCAALATLASGLRLRAHPA
jgi:hypothetical protein